MHTCKKCNENFKLKGSSHIGTAIKLDGFCSLFCSDKQINFYILQTLEFTNPYQIINKDAE